MMIKPGFESLDKIKQMYPYFDLSTKKFSATKNSTYCGGVPVMYDAENRNFVGIIEDHCRHVAERYFVGWKFENNRFFPMGHQLGKSKTCDTYEEALRYIQEPFE